MSAFSQALGIAKAALPEAIGLIEALVEAGEDPVVVIRRMRDAVEQRRDAGTEDAWRQAIEAKPKRGDTMPSPPPVPSSTDTTIYD